MFSNNAFNIVSIYKCYHVTLKIAVIESLSTQINDTFLIIENNREKIHLSIFFLFKYMQIKW